MTAPQDETDEKPLDPAVERVRRKLVRFVAVNLGLLLVALMAVIGAIVYKWEPERSNETAGTLAIADGEAIIGEVPLPAGARVLSHSLSGDRISLHVQSEGSGSILVYDIAERSIVGRFDLVAE